MKKKGLSIQAKLIMILLASVTVPILVVAVFSYFNASNALEELAFNQLTTVLEEKKDNISGELEGLEIEITLLQDSVGALVEEAYLRLEIITELKNAEAAIYIEDHVTDGVTALTANDTSHFNDIVHNSLGLGSTGETYIMERRPDGSHWFITTLLITGGGRYRAGTEFTNPLTGYLEEAFTGAHGVGIYADSTGKPTLVAFLPMDVPGRQWVMVTKMDLEEVLDIEVDGVHYFEKFSEHTEAQDLFLINPNGYVFHTEQLKSDYQANVLTGPLKDSGLGKVTKAVLDSQHLEFADFEPYDPAGGIPVAFIADPIVRDGRVEFIIAIEIPESHINEVMLERHGLGETGETYLVGGDNLMRSDSFRDPVYRTIRDSFANPELGSVDTVAARKALAGQHGLEIIENYAGRQVLSAYAPLDVFHNNWAIIAEIEVQEAMKSVTTLRNIMIIISAVTLAVVAVVGFLFAVSIARPLLGVSKELEGSSHQIASASAQLNSTSQIIANGASEQATGIEETTASVEELSSMVSQNSENAKQMNALAGRSEESSRDGYEQMKNLLTSMEALNDASDKIAQINQVIDSIAFQTNILALNAAVEAARAGEAGMGFAVVADEVKNLANKSAESAKETGALIENSINQINETLTGARALAELFNEIITQGTKVNEMSKEVEVASVQQAQGLEQINETINQFEKVSQANASSAEEAASASDELSAQANVLQAIVGQLTRIISGRSDGMATGPITEQTRLLPEPDAVEPAAPRQAVRKAAPRPTPPKPAADGPTLPGTSPEELIPFEEDDEFEKI